MGSALVSPFFLLNVPYRPKMIRNAFSFRGRIILDAILTVLFVLAFGLRFTGEVAHALIGATAFILLVVHLAAGWAWVKNLFNGMFTVRRWFTIIINIFLFIVAVSVFGSGLVLFLRINDGIEARQVHTTAAYWLLVLMGVHVGLYWKNVVSGVRFMAQGMTGQWAWRLAAHLPKAGLLFALYGVWASCERSMGSKLFFGFSFDFWDKNWPIFLFFVNHLAVMSVYIVATKYTVRFAGKALGQRQPVSATLSNGEKTKNSHGD
jgi:hypothetical protein